jgi:hypothetical protein
MSLRTGGKRLARRVLNQVEFSFVDIPAFLCPGFITTSRNRVSYTYLQQRKLHAVRDGTSLLHLNSSEYPARITTSRVTASINRLPPQCSGCGALSQTIDKDEPGYFDLKRKSVKQYLAGTPGVTTLEEDTIFEQALQRATENDPQLASQLGLNASPSRHSKILISPELDSTNICKRL